MEERDEHGKKIVVIDNNITVSELCLLLKNIKYPIMTLKGFGDYVYKLNIIIEYMGDFKLKDITQETIISFRDYIENKRKWRFLTNEKPSATTIEHVMDILFEALDFAVENANMPIVLREDLVSQKRNATSLLEEIYTNKEDQPTVSFTVVDEINSINSFYSNGSTGDTTKLRAEEKVQSVIKKFFGEQAATTISKNTLFISTTTDDVFRYLNESFKKELAIIIRELFKCYEILNNKLDRIDIEIKNINPKGFIDICKIEAKNSIIDVEIVSRSGDTKKEITMNY